MTLSSVSICIAALTAFSAFASAGQSCETPNGTLEDLSTAANNSYFLKWRPTFHFQAPNSWMNGISMQNQIIDMQTPISDITTPHLKNGLWATSIIMLMSTGVFSRNSPLILGNISIGGAFSDDLIHWTDSGAGWQDPTVIGTGPNGSYDHLGVFSGATVENGYMGYPTAFYTSVSRLPIGWSIPYLTGSETQSFAYTKDNGVTWIKYSQGNPVIPHPPSDLNVTGWRDPLIFRDANFAAVLNDADDTVYMTLSSGQRPTAGGRLLLYRSQDSNLTEWDYLGVMFSAHGNESYSVFSGNYGFNFEMSGYRSLVSEEGDILHVVTFGTEGGRTDANGNATHGNHWPLFAAGSMSSSGVLNASMSGVLDWGETYAYLGIQDPVNNRHLLWDWIYEDDNGYGMLAKGWQGSLGLPRVLSVKTVKGVTDSKARATEKGSWDAKEESDGTFTIRVVSRMTKLIVDIGTTTHSRSLSTSKYRNTAYFSTHKSQLDRLSGSDHRSII
jgi:beta-fructofuranosidase